MKNSLQNIGWQMLIGVPVLVGMSMMFAGCGKNKAGAEKVSEMRNVEVAEAFVDSVVLHKTLPGLISSATTTNVVAQVNGKILSQKFTGGQYVKKGDVLFVIESTTYRDAVERAAASLVSAKSQKEYYTKQVAAMHKALEADAVSKMQVAQAESNLAQAEASIKDAEATLSTARFNLGHCTITAPASGYISGANMDPGNYVSGEGGAITLATIYDNDNLHAVFSISDLQYEELVGKTGGLDNELYREVPVSFREPLQNNYSINLYYESPTIDESTGTLVLKGKLTNRNNELKNGMYVSVSLPYGVNPHAVLVKDAALSSDQLGYYLYTIDASNKVCHTPVEVGDLYADSLRIINSGIEPGVKYVTKALLNVRSGETVNPVLTK